MLTNTRWKRRPEGSTWGDWGEDDQFGRLNLLGPEQVKKGIAEVREGIPFCLSLPLDYPGEAKVNPRRHPPVLQPTIRDGKPNLNFPLSLTNRKLLDVVSDDAALIHLQYSTQWDSFAHVGQQFDADGDGEPEMVYYNGYRAWEHVIGPIEYRDGQEIPVKEPPGARALGIERMAEKCVQGRAVMIDLLTHCGWGRTVVGYDRLMRAMEADEVEVEPGDMVCLRTGFADLLLQMRKKPDVDRLNNSCAALDGRDERLLQWITDSGLVILASDNYAVEQQPALDTDEDPCCSLPLHAHCLFKLGVHLGEMWLLSPLADWLRAHRRTRFFLTAPPLRLPGAVGSPANAIGTV
ncbi:MAG: cyclase family protein [Alphaproteobacteria bacterium]|nr:cyclase family protein [Alphaproteobacteria bacterium]